MCWFDESFKLLFKGKSCKSKSNNVSPLLVIVKVFFGHPLFSLDLTKSEDKYVVFADKMIIHVSLCYHTEIERPKNINI